MLWITALGGIILIIAALSRQIGFCPPYSYSICAAASDRFAEALLPVVPLFIFSLITYWPRNEIYESWFRFARWWIPLSMLAILIAPEYSSDWMYSIEKGTVAFATSALFALVSLIIIIARWASLREK